MEQPPDIRADHHSMAAGRDITVEHVSYLSASQIHALGIEPCPRCEERLLSKGLHVCRHCANDMARDKQKETGIVLVFAYVLCAGGSLHLATLLHLDDVHAFTFAALGGGVLLGLGALAVRRLIAWLETFDGHQVSR